MLEWWLATVIVWCRTAQQSLYYQQWWAEAVERELRS